MSGAGGEGSVVISVGIMVLGMHRSGTSVVTNLLAELGCDLGGPTIEGRPDNPRGYFEHPDVTAIHEELLRATGRAWSDPWPIADDDLRGAAAGLARERLEEVLRRDLLPHPLWALKDPRLCRLTRLWEGVLDGLPCEVRVLHTIRSPFAVAGSLAARDGIPAWKSQLLWLRHVLEAELFSRRGRRSVVQLEDLERRPEAELLRLCEELGVAGLLDASRVPEVVRRVFAPELVHHRALEAGQGCEVHPWVGRAHACLRALGGDGEAAARVELDSLRQQLELADRLSAPDRRSFELELEGERATRLHKEMERHNELVAVQRREVDAARQEVAVLREHARAQIEEWMALRAELGRLRDRLGDPAASTPPRSSATLPGATAGRAAGNAPPPGLTSQLATLAGELEVVRGLVEAARGELRGGFEGIGTRHVEVLGRSIDFASRLEERWVGLEAELGRLRGELDQARAAVDRVTAERDRVAAERERAVAGRGEAVARGEALLAELERLRAQHAGVVADGERLARDLHRTISTRSWRYTAPARRLWGWVRGAMGLGAT